MHGLMDSSARLYSCSDTRSELSNSMQVPSSDSEDQLSEDEAQPEVRSLLDRLKAPKSSDLARKRKVQSNPPVGMKHSKKGRNSVFAPKSITPYDCVKEHPGEPLTVTSGTLLFSLQIAAFSQVSSHQASHKIC